jgi:hypothetical protein
MHILDRKSVFFVFSIIFSSFALDDLPIYLDAGCPNTGIPKTYARGPATMEIAKLSGGDAIPITCTEAKSGSDAAIVHNTKKFGNGENFDFIFKWGDDKSHSIKQYKDVRFWIKNRNSTTAFFRIGWESSISSTPPFKAMEIPGDQDWKEYIIPVSELGPDSALIMGFRVTHPLGQYNNADTNAAPLNILIDSITITDGTNSGSLAIPLTVHNNRPSSWPPTFLVGSFDNRELNKSTVDAQGGCSYRYQYVMPNILNEYSPSKKGYVYDYALESEKLGVKTAIVWYNLGKSGEGYDAISKNLQDAAYMKSYVDRYDSVLNQMTQAGQSDYMIVIEPDMYGFIMRGEKFHPADIAVNMTRANEVAKKTYSSNMIGWAQFMIQHAKEKLPKGVILGHMPNHWGVNIPGQVGQGRKEAHIMSGLTIGQFIKEMGPEGMGDVVFVEKTDHDAGHKPSGENWFWDSTGYGKYFLWTRAIAWRTGLPIVGWQVSEGNMNHPKTANRDNVVETFLAHPQWWMDGGFIGILFGAGNSDCANYLNDNDNGWFVGKMKSYHAAPFPFPVTGGSSFEKRADIEIPGEAPLTVVGKKIRLHGFHGPALISIFDISGKCSAKARLLPGTCMDLTRVQPGFYITRIESEDRLTKRSQLITLF